MAHFIFKEFDSVQEGINNFENSFLKQNGKIDKASLLIWLNQFVTTLNTKFLLTNSELVTLDGFLFSEIRILEKNDSLVADYQSKESREKAIAEIEKLKALREKLNSFRGSDNA